MLRDTKGGRDFSVWFQGCPFGQQCDHEDMEGWGALFPRTCGPPCNLSALAHLGTSLHRPLGSDSPAPEPWLPKPICPHSGGQSPVALSTQILGAPCLPLTLVPSLLCTPCKLHVPVPWRAVFCKPPLALAMLPNLLQWGEPPWALGRGLHPSLSFPG